MGDYILYLHQELPNIAGNYRSPNDTPGQLDCGVATVEVRVFVNFLFS